MLLPAPLAVQAPQPVISHEKLVAGMQNVAKMDFLDLLPLTLKLDNRPMNVRKARPMFSPLFRRKPIAPRQIYLCGRQIGKTASAGSAAAMNCIWRIGFRILYVAPLALYCTRLHHLYMGKMIRYCQLPWEIQDKFCVNNVNEKTFASDSHFHAVSCFNTAGNALGIPADMVLFDEVQDLNIDFVPQILETLGTSEYKYELYFGTARGKENTIQRIFDKTSQSEFAVKCEACNYWNIPSDDQDAIAMIQRHGVACARCERLLDVEKGQWVHAYPDRIRDFIGWHVPQTIVKARITPHSNYLTSIYDKLYGLRRYSMAKFKNEILGISVETGSSPITAQQIRDASVLDLLGKPINVRDYTKLAGGADWGGSEITSFTVGTVVGWHRSGKFHCLNAIRPTGIPDNERHFPLASFFKKHMLQDGQLPWVMADGQFVGTVQNKNLQHILGIPVGSVHYGTMKTFYRGQPGNAFMVDRTTLLYIVFTLIKEGLLLFPKGEEFEIFTEDLKSTYIEEIDTPRGQIIRYARYEQNADDFLHALGYAVFGCALAEGGIDLPQMVGMDFGSSVTRNYIETIGEEMPIDPGSI